MGVEARFDAIKASLPQYDGQMDYHTLETRLMRALGSSLWLYLEPDGFVLTGTDGVVVDTLEVGVATTAEELKDLYEWYFDTEESERKDNDGEEMYETLLFNGVQIKRKVGKDTWHQSVYRKLGIGATYSDKEHGNNISLIQACLMYVFSAHQISDEATRLIQNGRFRMAIHTIRSAFSGLGKENGRPHYTLLRFIDELGDEGELSWTKMAMVAEKFIRKVSVMDDNEKTVCLKSVAALLLEQTFSQKSYQEFRLAILRDAKGDYSTFTNYCRIAYKDKTCIRRVTENANFAAEATGNAATAITSSDKVTDKICFHCKKAGHIEKDCYYKHPHLRERALKRKSGVSAPAEKLRKHDPASVTTYLKELMERLGSTANFVQEEEEDAQANKVESVEDYSVYLVDSGASQHCVARMEGLVNVKETGKLLVIADGSRIDVTHTASFPVDIGQVLVVPRLQQPLISVRSLCERGYKVTFREDEVLITHAGNGVTLRGVGKRQGYFLTRESADALFYNGSCMVASVDRDENGNVTYIPGPLQRLHLAFGHIDASRLRRCVKNGSLRVTGLTVDDLKEQEDELICPGCMYGKNRKELHARSTTSTREMDILGKIAIDYKGPFTTPTLDGETGFYLISDKVSHMLWARPVKNKTELLSILKELDSFCSVHYKRTFQIVQGDAEQILSSEGVMDWLHSTGKVVETSAPYRKFENGQIERDIQTVMNTALAMLHGNQAPIKLWPYAIHHATNILNIVPTTTTGVAPLEMLTGKKDPHALPPPFFSRIFAYIYPEERRRVRNSALTPKSWSGYYVGYTSYRSKNMKVYCPARDSVFIRGDVTVDWSQYCINGVPTHLPYPTRERALTATEQVSYSEPTEVEFTFKTTLDGGDDDEERGENTVTHIPEPKTFEEALSGPHAIQWLEAVTTEWENLQGQRTFEKADPSGRAMTARFVFKVQQKNDGSTRFKARLVARGFLQKEGVDFKQTFAPTTDTTVVFLLLHLSKHTGKTVHTFDVKAAFLEGRNDTEQYIRLPAALCGGESLRFRIAGNLYGQRQAPRIWYLFFEELLNRLGFKRCDHHPVLFRRVMENSDIMVTIHVDDGLVVGNSNEEVENFIAELRQNLQGVTHLTQVTRFLGLELVDNGDCWHVSQQQYLKERLQCGRARDHACRQRVPMQRIERLADETKSDMNTSILPITGFLRFAADRARPDILPALGILSSGTPQQPTDAQLTMLGELLEYLGATTDLYMKIGSKQPICLVAFVDANFERKGKAKGRIGGCIYVSDDSAAIKIFSRSCPRYVSSVSGSTCEAEIKAIYEMTREVLVLRQILAFLGYPMNSPTIIYNDNEAAVTLCNNGMATASNIYLNPLLQVVHKALNSQDVTITWKSTDEMPADCLTKPLEEKAFLQGRTALCGGYGEVYPALKKRRW